MKIVKLKGGLGNQLFQYAFLRNLEIKYGCNDVKVDMSYYFDISNDSIRVPRIESLNVKFNKVDDTEKTKVCSFNHTGNPLTLKYKAKLYAEKTINKKYFFEPDRSYRDINKLLNYSYYDGYWQAWKYVDSIEEELRMEITPKFEFSDSTKTAIQRVSNENSVFIGIRRGDYVEDSKARKHFGFFGMDYYLKAIEYIKEKIENPVFHIFSNDIDWVKSNMPFEGNFVYRDNKDQTSDVEELFIMGSCKHAIIVNSTFNWWGAWMINNKDKIVVAPEKWFADGKPIEIVPESWIKL